MQVTSKKIEPLQRLPYYLKMIPGVLGHSLKSYITYKFLYGQHMFPEYFSISYDYVESQRKIK